MNLVSLVKVFHVGQGIKDTASHEVVALVAVVFVGSTGLGKLDVLLSVLERYDVSLYTRVQKRQSTSAITRAQDWRVGYI